MPPPTNADKIDGGAAYPNGPCQIQDGNTRRIYEPTPGMSMRQRYKLAALQGLLAQPDQRSCNLPSSDVAGIAKWRAEITRADVAVAAIYADACLAEDEEHAKK
jgi:hypothetical protein